MEGLYVVTVEATPAAGSDAFASHGGAYINVFTTDASESEALSTASREIAEAGWQFNRIDDVTWVTRSDYADDPSGLEYFEQALIDGVVIVVHIFSPDQEGQDVLH